MKKLISAVLLGTFIPLFCCSPLAEAATITPTPSATSNALQVNNKFMLYNSQELAENNASVIKAANVALKQAPLSVTQKKVLPPSGDPHDYISLSKYYWPDPTKPDGLPYIPQDGLTNPEKSDPTLYDNKSLGKLIGSVKKLSSAYYITGEEKYASKSVELLKAWFIAPETRMNPNLNYGQVIPGKPGISSSGIIETVDLISIVDAAGMLEKSPEFKQEDQVALKAWFNDYLTWLLTSNMGIHEGNTLNNHSVWYDAQVSAYAHYAGRDDIAVQVINDAKEKRIQTQIMPDGKMPKELSRTNSMDYTAYNLQAFITLARIGDEVGVNIWDYQSSDGRSIEKAIGYFIPYLLNKDQWEYKQIGQFNDNGFARYLSFAKQHYNTNKFDVAISELQIL